jgi:hypothetical protein
MSQGRVRYFQMAGPNWDVFTSSSDLTVQAAIRNKVSGIGTYGPYFDNKLSWFPKAWVYFDSYAIYTTDSVATQHPEWILRDAGGNKLYIPWNCAAGTCPQFAGDIASPSFRAYQISRIEHYLKPGYAGLWLDDVNLLMRTSDSDGKAVIPVSTVTGQPMTNGQWETYFAEYVELIRTALPMTVSILHNSLWFVSPSTAAERQVQAADLINIERGFGDPGLTGGNGQASLAKLMSYIGMIHTMGKAVVVEDYTIANRIYSVAAYLLINNGYDMIGFNDQLPDAWMENLFSTDLGSALTPCYTWCGVWRRDFTRGMVLVNEPGADTVTVSLPSPMFDENGNKVSVVTLPAMTGMILHAPKVS